MKHNSNNVKSRNRAILHVARYGSNIINRNPHAMLRYWLEHSRMNIPINVDVIASQMRFSVEKHDNHESEDRHSLSSVIQVSKVASLKSLNRYIRTHYLIQQMIATISLGDARTHERTSGTSCRYPLCTDTSKYDVNSSSPTDDMRLDNVNECSETLLEQTIYPNSKRSSDPVVPSVISPRGACRCHDTRAEMNGEHIIG